MKDISGMISIGLHFYYDVDKPIRTYFHLKDNYFNILLCFALT